MAKANKPPKPTPTRTVFTSKAAAARLSSPLCNYLIFNSQTQDNFFMENDNPDPNTLNRYLELMSEIKKRDEVIRELHEGVCNIKYRLVTYEVMYFQLRKILEIIAKAPMIVNENEYRSISKKPEHDWRLKEIMGNLKQLNPSFYPQPIKIIKSAGAPDHFSPIKLGYLTETELQSAYDRCNAFMHATNPLKDDTSIDFQSEWDFIDGILKKIRILLSVHLAHPAKQGYLYYICMNNLNDNGNPGGNIFGVIGNN